MNCYFDGSIDGPGQWLTLAGLAATDITWAIFQKQWTVMLRERYPIAPYLHMTDLVTRNDPFERHAGWTDCKVTQLVDDALVVMHSAEPGTLCAFACSIDIAARKRLIAEGYKITDPAVICAELGIGALLNWYTRVHRLELFYLFYDRNEPFIRSIKRRWNAYHDQNKRQNKLVVDDLFWGSIAGVQDVRMDKTPAIQAADMVAWAATRRIRNAPNDNWARLATSLIGIRGQPGMLTTHQLDPIDEAVMRRKYHKK